MKKSEALEKAVTVMKTEEWNGHEIRFVEKEGEWWAVLKDIADALDYRDAYNVSKMIDDDDKGTAKVSTLGGTQNMIIISEFGIYDAIFNSRKPEAKEFKKWVFEVIKELRKQTGLEGYKVFRMLDKEHQKQAMEKLKNGMNPEPKNKIPYVKANNIANKAISKMYGFPKMIKKDQMTPEMQTTRQAILDETVDLMTMDKKFGLNLSISQTIYKKWCSPQHLKMLH